MNLWKIINSDKREINYVSFNNMIMHGTWEMTINIHGLVDSLNIKFHWTGIEQKARLHKFKLVHSTNSWVCRPQHRDEADWTQWLIAVTKVQDPKHAAAAIGGLPHQVVHWCTFKHSAADWHEDRSLSLWKIVNANNQLQNQVTFDGSSMHGQWELIKNHDGVVERLLIKFHFKADEFLAQWHDFTPVVNTNSWVCHPRSTRSTMWLIALAHVEDFM